MKKLIPLLAAAILFAACSKKQTPKPVVVVTPLTATVSDITGVWVIDIDSVSTTSNGKTTVIADTNTGGINFTFNADGTGAEATQAFTYTLASGIITIKETNNTTTPPLPFVIITITTRQLTIRYTQPNETQDFVMHKQ